MFHSTVENKVFSGSVRQMANPDENLYYFRYNKELHENYEHIGCSFAYFNKELLKKNDMAAYNMLKNDFFIISFTGVGKVIPNPTSFDTSEYAIMTKSKEG